MTQQRRKSVQGPKGTFTEPSEVSPGCEMTVSRSVNHVAMVEVKVKRYFVFTPIFKGLKGNLLSYSLLTKKSREKKILYCHSPAFRAIQTDRSAYLRVTTKWFHAVSLHLFS